MYRTGQLYTNGATNKRKYNYPFIWNNFTPVPKNVINGMGLNIYKLTSAAVSRGKWRALYSHFNVAQ